MRFHTGDRNVLANLQGPADPFLIGYISERAGGSKLPAPGVASDTAGQPCQGGRAGGVRQRSSPTQAMLDRPGRCNAYLPPSNRLSPHHKHVLRHLLALPDLGFPEGMGVRSCSRAGWQQASTSIHPSKPNQSAQRAPRTVDGPCVLQLAQVPARLCRGPAGPRTRGQGVPRAAQQPAGGQPGGRAQRSAARRGQDPHYPPGSGRCGIAGSRGTAAPASRPAPRWTPGPAQTASPQSPAGLGQRAPVSTAGQGHIDRQASM